jgi:hypothetical protein
MYYRVAGSIALVYVHQYVRFVLIRRALHYTKFSAHVLLFRNFAFVSLLFSPLLRTSVRAFGSQATRLVLREISCA